MELDHCRDGFRKQEHRMRGPVAAGRRSRPHGTWKENARDRPGHYFVDDPRVTDRAASSNRLRSRDRETMGPYLARTLVAQCDRRHARVNASLSTRARPWSATSGMVQLGQVVCRLVDPAAAGGWFFPKAVETRKQRGRRADRNHELLSGAPARDHERRDR